MAEDIVFYLRGRPFGGGVNSVVQEFMSLVDNFGVGRLLVEERHLDLFRRGYDWSVEAMDRLSTDPKRVPAGAAVVATTNDSLDLVIDLFAKEAARGLLLRTGLRASVLLPTQQTARSCERLIRAGQ